MKKKTSWKTWAGLILAAGAWRRLSTDLPIDGVIIPPAEEPPAGPPPVCGRFETPKYDYDTRTWRCVPKGLL